MYFWDEINLAGKNTACIDENNLETSYDDLNLKVEVLSKRLRKLGNRKLGFLLMGNTVESVVAYLGSLRAGHVSLLLPDDVNEQQLLNLVELYNPNWIISIDRNKSNSVGDSTVINVLNTEVGDYDNIHLHEDLALLLSTSGSTGSPKLVRLSHNALQSNANAIVEYLEIDSEDRALTVLPAYYSYGLSVINSHLKAKATLVIQKVSVIDPGFLDILTKHRVTTISGVPYIYQMLKRTGFFTQQLPYLQKITQAGGKLDDKLMREVAEACAINGIKFYVMYGQTEATARISYVPYQRLLDKVGSIGIPIPGGCLEIDGESGELVYKGDNVMMGYAENKADLQRSDELAGVLRTGDLAQVDSEGFFYIVGRAKRFLKLAGSRYNLDEIETQLQSEIGIPIAVGGKDDKMIVLLETDNSDLLTKAKTWIQLNYRLHHSMFRVKCVDILPLLSTGKKDYQAIQDQ